jgi:tryptophan 2,3-dioxygenase
MPKPARWQNDPDCGHEVACEFQTHYCTYIRVPRLLTLQHPQTDDPAEPFAILALQAYELWLAVLNCDLQTALDGLATGSPQTFEPTKLLRRCSRLIKLLDRQTDLAATVLVHDARFVANVRPSGEAMHSPQFERLCKLTEALEAQLTPQAVDGPPHAEAARDYLGRFAEWQTRYAHFMAQIMPDMAPTSTPEYTNYVVLSELLALQDGVKADWAPKGSLPAAIAAPQHVSPDELLFIVVHQAFELWFKAILIEIDATLADMLAEPAELRGATRRLRRAVRVQKLLTEQIHIPATMQPLDFFRFRSQSKVVDGVTYQRGLSPSSGTESYQFREIEIAGGLKADEAHAEFLQGNPRLAVRYFTPDQRRRLAQPSLPEAFERLLTRRGVRDVNGIYAPSDTPNPHGDLAELADVLLEFDEFFRFWRINHVAMVQTMIGERSGTGYLGPEYLRETVGLGQQGEGRIFSRSQTRPRFFEALWAARTRLGSQ